MTGNAEPKADAMVAGSRRRLSPHCGVTAGPLAGPFRVPLPTTMLPPADEIVPPAASSPFVLLVITFREIRVVPPAVVRMPVP